jgi:methylglutaconyl-CoA hydratase
MESQSLKGSIQTTIENKIATIEFEHPASNSLTQELLHKVASELTILSTNPAISVVILKSSGTGVFCAGASFDELLAVSNLDQATKFFSGFAHLLNAMRTCSKVIIGRVHGKAVGGGLGIIAACDYVFATMGSSIKLSELSIGIGPFVIEPALSRKMGKAATAALTLASNEWKDSEWAKSSGLFTKVFAGQVTLDKELVQFSTKLASYNPEAVSEIKKILWEGTENWETLLYERAAISGKLALSEYTKQALQEFKK